MCFLSTLTAEVSENTTLVLQKVPGGPKLNDSAVIKDENPGFRVSRILLPRSWVRIAHAPSYDPKPNSIIDSLVQTADCHQTMCNHKHLRILKRCAEYILNCCVGCVIEIGCALVHDEERRRSQFEQATSECEQLPLTLACKNELFRQGTRRIVSATLQSHSITALRSAKNNRGGITETRTPAVTDPKTPPLLGDVCEKRPL